MSVRIISDSTCDLSEELIKKYDVLVLPLHVMLGDEEYRDGKNISPDEIYRWSDAKKATPKTSAPSITDVMDVMHVCSEDDSDIICFSVSEQMSTSGNVMRMAAVEMGIEERVHVIDSASLSTGVGLLVIEAAVMAQKGCAAEEIVTYIESIKPYVRASFVVDTLTYLYRGGRCGGLTALAGGALKIHPRIVVEDGAMKPEKKYRGKLSNVILNYVEDMEPQMRNAKRDRVFITHSGCDAEVIDKVYQYLEKLNIFDEILVTRAGSVISSHCGPGTLGVLFIEKKG